MNVIANGVYDAAQWLTYEGGISWEHNLLFFGGHSVIRSLIPEGNEGSGIICKLDKRAEGLKNLKVCRNTKADELVQDASGAVVGLKATNTATGETYDFKAKAVILAAGGFGSNVEMRMKYNPEMDEKILSTDSVGATGDCHVMAEKIGANLIDMQYIQTYPTCDTQTAPSCTWATCAWRIEPSASTRKATASSRRWNAATSSPTPSRSRRTASAT